MKFKGKIILVIAVIVAIFLVFTFQYFKEQNEDTKEVIFYNNSQRVTEVSVEIADDNEEISRGLMHREELPENNGMLFIFGAKQRKQGSAKQVLNFPW